MPQDSKTVYLEDIDSNYSTKRPRTDSNATPPTPASASDAKTAGGSAAVVTKAPKTSTMPPAKRQRTIGDMFIGKNGQIVAPRSANSSSLPKLNSIPFSLGAFEASLNDDQKRLLRLECDVLGRSWLKVLKDEITKPYFLSLKEFLWNEGVRGADDAQPNLKIHPPARDIYTWSNTPLGKVKVVIIGQDPYHGRGQAHGLCFSVLPGKAAPPSLVNIYKELKSEYPDFVPPKHGHLKNWADNGVLMLNSVLTVREGNANSHADQGWEKFTDAVIDIVDKYGGANLPNGGNGGGAGFGRGVVFLAWGAYAARRVARLSKVSKDFVCYFSSCILKSLDRCDKHKTMQAKHLILTSSHPSPKSAERGFFGNNHFKQANDWLSQKYGQESQVDWCNLTVPSPEAQE